MRLEAALAVGAMAALLAAGDAAPEQEAKRHSVRISMMKFQPATLTVAPGDTVVWTNEDIVPHDVSAPAFRSPTLPSGATFEWTAPQRPGKHDFRCTLHPGMSGSVVVK